MSSSAAGLVAAILAYGAWGFFPLYFRLLDAVPPLDILAWRIALSCALLLAVLLATRGPRELVRRVRENERWGGVVAATLAISINWYAFIHAVAIGEVLQTSLGYFLVPLVNSALGILVFGERPGPLKRIALALASLGMLATFVMAGKLPWISLILAGSFGLYGMLRKSSTLDSSTGLLFETALLAPVAIAWLLLAGAPVAPLPNATLAALMAAGTVTLVPLLAMVYAARRIELGTLGVVQYLTPVLQFGIAIRLFDEALDPAQTLAFATAVAAIGFWIAGSVADRRARRRHRP